MYYGFVPESVIIARPRNAHRRPLIPPLAILFSSLLARPCRCQGTLLSWDLSLLSVPRVSFLLGPASRCSHSIIIIGSLARVGSRVAPLFVFSSLQLSSIYTLLVPRVVPNFITFYYELTDERPGRSAQRKFEGIYCRNAR